MKNEDNNLKFNLSFGYYKQELLFGLASFCVHKNKKHLLCAEAGAGKTTLLEILAGLNREWQGEAGGQSPKEFGWGTSVTFLPSSPVLFGGKSVFKNIEYAFKVLKIKKPYSEKLNEVLKLFGLEEKAKVKAKKLDYLDKLKVSLARSYIKNADVLLIDDLFKNAPSEEEQNKIWAEIKKLNLENKTIIMAINDKITPQIDFDYFLKIENKKIIEEKVNNNAV